MSADAIIILLVALLAAGTLLAARAGIHSIQRARKVVFYRTRRSYMLAGWQWLALAILLLSSTVASALFGRPVANQVFPGLSTEAVTFPTASPIASPEHLSLPVATSTVARTQPSAAFSLTPTGNVSPAPTDPSSVIPTFTPSPTRTQSPTATQPTTSSSTPRNPSPTANLSALATRASGTLQAQLVTADLSNTPTVTKTATLVPTRSPTSTATLTLTSTSTHNPNFTDTTTPTRTPIPSRTASPTRTPRPTLTLTPTITNTLTQTLTLTPSQTFTPSSTSTTTPTRTPIPTWTSSPTRTPRPTLTFTSTSTETLTSTASFTPTLTLTSSLTPTLTSTRTPIPTWTLSPTRTLRPTLTLTFTATKTATSTASLTPTRTFTPSLTSTGTASATPSQTRTQIPTLTPSPSRTLRPTVTLTFTPSRVPSPTWTPMYTNVRVYFTDNKRLIAGQLPYEVSVSRFVLSSKERVAAVLDEFFKGPSDVERNKGLAQVLNGFTGYSRLVVANGGVYVYLAGNCQSNGTLYSIANPLMANLKQFPTVQFVKIYDQLGHTRAPAARVDSIPACLDPTFTPSPTPLPTSTLSSPIKRTPTPLWTVRPFFSSTPTKIYGPPG